ncbi:MAG: PIG-L deacetylase family protein [Parvularculaceae bacterium]
MRILVIAPHADDESLGAGGAIARHVANGDDVTVALMTGPDEDGTHPFIDPAAFEKVRGEFHKALDVLGVERRVVKNLPAVAMANSPVQIVNAAAKAVVEEARPERLYVPFAFDLHKDHRELFYAFAVQWRAYLPTGQAIREVLAYETPSETHLAAPYVEPSFTPNVFIDVSAHLDKKLAALACYESQRQDPPLPRSPQAIEALARLRGSQIGVDAAEAFVLVRRLET